MSLFEWTGHGDILGDVRAAMRVEGEVDLSEAACKVWASAFIQRVAPSWVRGQQLTLKEAMTVGERLDLLARGARRRIK